MFESLANDDGSCNPSTYSREPWVEQVDFRLPDYVKNTAPKVSLKDLLPQRPQTGNPIPSLDQISARLGQIRAPTVDLPPSRRSSSRFPAFLQTKPGLVVVDEGVTKAKPRLATGVGRLQMPIQSPPINSPKPIRADLLPPSSPRSPLLPNLTITTLVVSRSSSVSPTELSESNLLALDSRGKSSRDMASRRVPPSEHSLTGHAEEEDRKKWRRQSCPPELGLHKAREGFEHPVLVLPGAF
jgi:hypothetical protein